MAALYSPGQIVFARSTHDRQEYLALVDWPSNRNPNRARVRWLEKGGSGDVWAVIIRAAHPKEIVLILQREKAREIEEAERRGRNQAWSIWQQKSLAEADPADLLNARFP